MDKILELLMFLLPTGGIGAALGWLVSAKVRKARSDEETTNIYRILYEGLHKTVTEQNEAITEQQNQLLKLQRSQLRLTQAVNQARICRYWGNHCPIRLQLQNLEEGEPKPRNPRGAHAAPRQHEPQGDATDEPHKPPQAKRDDDATTLEPP